jgi:hypothetical protein
VPKRVPNQRPAALAVILRTRQNDIPPDSGAAIPSRRAVRVRTVFAIPCLAVLALSCTEGPARVNGVPDAGAGSGAVVILPGSLQLEAGATTTVTAVDAEGRSISVKWSTSNPAVATVSSAGVIRAVAPGAAAVSARSKNLSGSAPVDVVGPAPVDPGFPGLWIGSREVRGLPTSGAAWTRLREVADGNCGTPDLADQESNTNVCIVAKALVFARTGETRYRDDVVSALRTIADAGTYSGRALALGRQLGGYAIAADLVQLQRHAPDLDTRFRAKLRELLVTPTTDGPRTLVECHERRPNNWGTHCGGARIAVAAYLGDNEELARASRVFRGWLGDRSAYAGFSFGSDLTWHCDANAPVAVNPRGCTKQGVSIDGVLPDDQRRGGSFRVPPPAENYVYEALQGALMQAVILSRHGYDVWNWQDRALLRAFDWLHDVAAYPAEGDDTWQPHIINRVYGRQFPAPVPSRPGKNIGWTDWTHG